MNRHFSRCCPGGFTSVVLPRFWHPAPLDSNLQARTPAGPPVYRRPNSAGRRSTSQLAGENGQCAFLTAFPDALLETQIFKLGRRQGRQFIAGLTRQGAEALLN